MNRPKAQKHANNNFISFVKLLSPELRKEFQEGLVNSIQEVGYDHSPIQFKNWMAKRSKIPYDYYKAVNGTATRILKKQISGLVPEMDEKEISLNLFTEMNEKEKSKQDLTTIKIERARLNLTQEQLAEKAGVTTPTIWRLEKLAEVKRGFLNETAQKVCKVLGKPMHEFKEFNTD
jgi:DNA-binding XRE family transcriptional regulator